MSGKKLLIITYYWPPSGGVGVQRWLHFACNLKKMGWEPIIYTPENPQFEILDEKLNDLAKDIQVIKKPIWEPFSFFHKITGNKNRKEVQQGVVLEKSKKTFKDKLFVWIRGNLFIPDARVFWIRPSVDFLSEYIFSNDIGNIITTGPPHSMHMIGLKLKRKFPDLNWLADFRDPWSDWDILQRLQTGGIAMSVHKRFERKVLESADEAITVSKRLGLALDQKCERDKPVRVIENGIEAISFEKAIETDDSKFVIGYFGMLNELRDPEQLWYSLEKLCESDPNFQSKLEIRLGGIVSQSIISRLKNSSTLKDAVVFLGYISHEKVFEEYKKCDILLLLLNKSDNAKWILPVKFFEYLSANKPILTFGPDDSDLGDLLSEYAVGEMMNGNDDEVISKFILANFEKSYSTKDGDFEKLLQSNTREHQAKELAALIH
ncbi:MAG: glycosyl transferase [Cyclobacteriaceae bacterium]